MRRRGDQEIEQSLLGASFRLKGNLFSFRRFDERDGSFDQVADEAFDVSPVVTDLSVLGRLDLHERSANELGQATCDLRFPHAGWSDKQNILRCDLGAKLVRKL